MSVIHAPSRPKLDIRVLAFPGAMLILLVVLFFRLWYIQVVKAQELTDRADATRKDTLSRPAPRGMIYDRNGDLLAGLKPEIVVSIVYSVVSKNHGELEQLAAKLQTTVSALKSKIENAKHDPGLPTPLAIGVDPNVGAAIAECSSQFPGVGVDLLPTRYYPNGTDYPHILGLVRLPNARDIERIKKLGLVPAQYVGKSGIERSFESTLMGSPGDEVMEVDSKRRPIRVVQRDNPVPGKDLILSVDSKLQHFATQLMAQNNYTGAVVAVVPKTGEVLCMVSSPTYDQNLFQMGISKDAYAKLATDPSRPMTKRAIESSYSPGSTFKIVTSLAAFETGKFDPNRPVFCDGAFHLGKAKFTCLGHHGDITFQTALEKSCNTYFSDLGYRVGEKGLRQAALEAGLGESTGIDIGGEDLGLVPSDAYVTKHYKKRHWYGGDTVNFSIGQGWLRATPLQMCDVAAMVANDGTIYRPHLVHAVKDSLGTGSEVVTQPEVLHHVDASPDFWSTLKRALVGVIREGTARRAQIPNIEWGGKTGSTEHGHHLLANGKEPKTHSWFVGYAPADNPKIAICVLVENAGHGGDISAPVAKEIVQKYLKPQPAKAAAKVERSTSISASSLESPNLR